MEKAMKKKTWRGIIAVVLCFILVIGVSGPLFTNANAATKVSPFVLLRNGKTNQVELWLVVNSQYIVSQVRFKQIDIKSTSSMENKTYARLTPASGKTYMTYNMKPAAKKGRIYVRTITIPKAKTSAVVIPKGAQYYEMNKGWRSVGATSATVVIA